MPSVGLLATGGLGCKSYRPLHRGDGAAGPWRLSLRLVHPIEATASLLGLANIALLVRRSIWNYPFGMAMVALYAHIFFGQKLYSDAILQFFFFGIQGYGWWAWWRAGGVERPVAVERLTVPARIAWLVMIALLTLAWGFIMHANTDASYPWWDGGIAVASIAAQILLARRRIENWMVWIMVDIAAIPLYAIKQLYLTALLYGLFLLISALGLRAWMRAEVRA